MNSSPPAEPCLRAAALDVDLTAIADNYRWFAQRAGTAACAACVKADAYGLGLRAVARTLWQAGCREFFVASVGEGAALRALLPDALIYVLNGYLPAELPTLRAARLLPVLNDPTQVAAFEADFPVGTPAALQIDSGMTRLGLDVGDLPALGPRWRQPGAIGMLLSHLACAEQPDHPLNRQQLERFTAAWQALGRPRASLANSSGVLLGSDWHFDLVRPGAGLYGLNPQPDQPNPLRPVVRLHAPVLQVREVREDTSVGYGASYRMRAPGRIATVACGYADGYPRAASSRSLALVDGRRMPLIGRLSMDLLMLDVSALPPGTPRPGDEVELLGTDYDVDALAAAAGTIGYELLTHLGRLCRRRYHPAQANPPE
ncbi:MAG: alanine racemase [Immundisolibacter sp.]|uniref:alanine racemase n=1 Tax=Immundisolibacter sp. TaxID=1934948 RepID=UPI0019BF9CA6|nr:alanine racemase [Immundisolibacter sp.]MBC7162215.1 alanine racemase [Immundisolibacter sp.]